MEDDNIKGKVIKGPWKDIKKSNRKVVIPKNAEKLQEDLYFCDELTEGLLVQLIHTMNENGFDIKNEKFLQDIGFISECVKATLLRQMKYQHPVAILMDKVMSLQKQQNKENSQALSHFNFEELQKLLGKKDDPKTPKR